MCNNSEERLFAREGFPPSPFIEMDVLDWTEIGRLIDNDSSRQIIAGMARTMNDHSPVTGKHARGTAEFAVATARYVGLPDLAVLALYSAMLVHDQGKLKFTREEIEDKGKFTPEQRTRFGAHAAAGAAIIMAETGLPIKFRKFAAEIAARHHEHHDGSGWPDGLKGKEISTAVRLAKILDTLDACGVRGGYQPVLGVAGALTKMNDPTAANMAGKFDPDILAIVTQANTPKRPSLLAERRPSGNAGLIQAL